MARDDLSTPSGGGFSVGIHYDAEAFGRFSEAIARYLGTARFLVIQSAVVVAWVVLNAAVPAWRFDEYPFILLTLALSLQAGYAAPLILLAQNRQESRDRVQAEQDRSVNARTQADTEFLARELASLRIALADVVTTDDLADAVTRLTSSVERLERRLDGLAYPGT